MGKGKWVGKRRGMRVKKGKREKGMLEKTIGTEGRIRIAEDRSNEVRTGIKS